MLLQVPDTFWRFAWTCSPLSRLPAFLGFSPGKLLIKMCGSQSAGWMHLNFMPRGGKATKLQKETQLLYTKSNRARAVENALNSKTNEQTTERLFPRISQGTRWPVGRCPVSGLLKSSAINIPPSAKGLELIAGPTVKKWEKSYRKLVIRQREEPWTHFSL